MSESKNHGLETGSDEQRQLRERLTYSPGGIFAVFGVGKYV